jgi:hypothetical protein
VLVIVLLLALESNRLRLRARVEATTARDGTIRRVVIGCRCRIRRNRRIRH